MPDHPRDPAAAGSADSGASGFSAEWLALREPADARARDADLSTQLVELTQRASPDVQVARRVPAVSPLVQVAQRIPQSPVRIIDLACGTGSNLRYLAPRVGGDQHWLLVDNDAALLEKARGTVLSPARAAGLRACAADRTTAGEACTADSAVAYAARPADHAAAVAGCRVETRRLDLTTELQALDFAPGVVVTASALLDLVSGEWLARLVEHCRANRCIALFTLSYDGRIELTPSDPDDEWIRQLVNRHQLGDKGFGPALGPGAAQRAGELFSAAGFHVRTARSDWNLLPTERSLQEALLEGWSGAAADLAPNEADRCKRWLTRRLVHVANGTSRIIVGHQDMLAWPK